MGYYRNYTSHKQYMLNIINRIDRRFHNAAVKEALQDKYGAKDLSWNLATGYDAYCPIFNWLDDDNIDVPFEKYIINKRWIY